MIRKPSEMSRNYNQKNQCKLPLLFLIQSQETKINSLHSSNKDVSGIVTIRRISECPNPRSQNRRIDNDTKIRKQTLLEHFSKKNTVQFDVSLFPWNKESKTSKKSRRLNQRRNHQNEIPSKNRKLEKD